MMKKLITGLMLSGAIAASFCAAGCKGAEQEGVYSVYAPDGATALAVASVVKNGGDGFSVHTVSSTEIASVVTGESPKADFCVLPLNVAAKLLGTGEKYSLLGTVTNGNLYFLSTDGNESLTKENFATALVGKTVGVVQLNNVPGLTFRVVLDRSEAEINILGNDVTPDSEKINLRAIADAATEVVPVSDCDYFLCPEPAASSKIKGTASTAKPFRLAGSLQDLYGEGGYPQAVLVGKNSVLNGDKAATDKLLSCFEESESFLKTTEPAEIISYLADTYEAGFDPTLKAGNLTESVIANCSIAFTKSMDCKARVNAFLAELIAVDGEFTKTVSDSFFYEG